MLRLVGEELQPLAQIVRANLPTVVKARKRRVAASNTVSESKAPSCRPQVRRRKAKASNTFSESKTPSCHAKARRQRVATSNTISKSKATNCCVKTCK
ncbi:hypothetical protein GOBAR_DD15004 [Gossypium barbadense]|nr:hypothetical protein GOBAR_DD15004 [Gossypium barbadense]